MESKAQRILKRIFTGMFSLGILLFLLGRLLSFTLADRYDQTIDEVFVPEEIWEVLYDEDRGLIYVCYMEAQCVNVYDTEGSFRWAVAIPGDVKGIDFALAEDALLILDCDAYRYDPVTGEFLERQVDGALDYTSEQSGTWTPNGPGSVYHDHYEVFYVTEDGDSRTVVSRPWWFYIFNMPICFSVAILGLIGLAVMGCIQLIQERFRIRGSKQ